MKEASDILFENDSLVAIDKPSGILSVPDRYNPDKFSIAGWILSTHPNARPLHRLDYATSGIMVFCIDPEAFGWYSDQFEQRKVTKTYLAILEGRLREQSGIIDQPLFTQSNGKVIVSRRGKGSITQWEVVENFLQHSFVQANPLTGRTHQIRVHFQSIGHPVLCDKVYGAASDFYLSAVKGRKKYRLSKGQEAERPLLSRTALHAHRLKLQDYRLKEDITIESPLPKDLNVVLQKLRQYSTIVK